MANLVLMPENRGQYEDGDIVAAFSDRHIASRHIQIIAHPNRYQRNADRLIKPGQLNEHILAALAEYKLERVSRTEVRRIRLADGSSEIIGPTPNDRGEAMDVPLFIARRLRNPRHRLFGQAGTEYWYSEPQLSAEHIAAAWDAVEMHSNLRRSNYRHWPLTDTEKAHFAPVAAEPFDDAKAAELTAPLIGQNGKSVKARKYNIDIDSLPPDTPLKLRSLDPKDDARERMTPVGVDHAQPKRGA